jgi:hypothetical protein
VFLQEISPIAQFASPAFAVYPNKQVKDHVNLTHINIVLSLIFLQITPAVWLSIIFDLGLASFNFKLFLLIPIPSRMSNMFINISFIFRDWFVRKVKSLLIVMSLDVKLRRYDAKDTGPTTRIGVTTKRDEAYLRYGAIQILVLINLIIYKVCLLLLYFPFKIIMST